MSEYEEHIVSEEIKCLVSIISRQQLVSSTLLDTFNKSIPMSQYKEKVMKLDTETINSIQLLLSKIKRKKFSTSQEQSMSVVAAQEVTSMLMQIIKYYDDKISENSLKCINAWLDFAYVHCMHINVIKLAYRYFLYTQVTDLITLIDQVGRQLQRSSAFKMLLTNATRKVLFILHVSIQRSSMSETEYNNYFTKLVESYSDLVENNADNTIEKKNWCQTILEDCNSLKANNYDLFDNSSLGSSIDFDVHMSSSKLGQKETEISLGVSPEEILPHTSKDKDAPHLDDNKESINFEEGRQLPRLDAKQSLYTSYPPVHWDKYFQTILEAIEDLREDYENMTTQLCIHASQHIYSDEHILIHGCSHSILSFILAASENKKTRVWLLEGAPTDSVNTVKFQSILKQQGVECIIVPDSSCFTIMSRINKVLFSTEAVLANGGLLAPIGTHVVAMAATFYAVPILVVAMSIKLCPYYPSDRFCSGIVKISRKEAKEVLWMSFGSPEEIFPVHERMNNPVVNSELLQVYYPIIEYCPPSGISLFITDIGEFPPEDIHRIVREQYNSEDTHL